ncbi:MAG: outer membrane lipoprotein carrier protein LolA, partial [Candidatus Firestonebacteria bacterium]
MKKIILLLVFTGCCFSLNYSEALEKLTDSFNNKLETFRADVTQEVRIADMGEGQVLSGSITVKKPNKIMLEYRTPVKQDIISNGKTLWMYFKDKNQVIVQDMQAVENRNNIVFQLPRYLSYLKENYTGSLKEEKKPAPKNSLLLEFLPKTKNEDFTLIKLLVDKEKGLPLTTT